MPYIVTMAHSKHHDVDMRRANQMTHAYLRSLHFQPIHAVPVNAHLDMRTPCNIMQTITHTALDHRFF
jgi:aminoglycoside phosphotransferase